jgi:hypothetical protein
MNDEREIAPLEILLDIYLLQLWQFVFVYTIAFSLEIQTYIIW